MNLICVYYNPLARFQTEIKGKKEIALHNYRDQDRDTLSIKQRQIDKLTKRQTCKETHR